MDGGWQDQIIASYGGIQRIKSIKMEYLKLKINISKHKLDKLQSHLLLILRKKQEIRKQLYNNKEKI